MSNNWLKTRIDEIHSAHNDRTVVLAIHKTELVSLKDVIGDLATSKDFRLDLNMSQAVWAYLPETGKRALVIQHSSKAEESECVQKTALRNLAAKAVGELQTKKINDVEVLIGDSISRSILGAFAN